jgi:chorismate mutase/prephenate dehydrogenase
VQSGLPIRDEDRQVEVFEDRCARGDALGLPRELVASLFRKILAASRSQQTTTGARARGGKALTVAVLGGRGGLGIVMVDLFRGLGHDLLVADLDTELTVMEAASAADVVVVSVPILSTEEVIRQVGPALRPEAILMDVTSLKEGPMRAMLESTKANVVGTHPMFGPDVTTLEGQRVVLCPGRGEGALAWVRNAFEAQGVATTEVSAEEHDRAMAAVQVLTHYQTEVLGLVLARLGMSIDFLLRFTSPVYLLEAYVTARHFAQSPDLYGPIQMLNPLSREVTDAFQQAAADLSDILREGDQERFSQLFDDVSEYFGDFTTEALERSRHLIDDLVELAAERAAARAAAIP